MAYTVADLTESWNITLYCERLRILRCSCIVEFY